MNSIKKAFALCAAASMFFSGAVAVSATEASATVISVSNQTVKPGETGTFTVDLSQNTGIICWKVLIDYNPDVIEITGFQSGAFDGAECGAYDARPFVFSWGNSLDGNNTTEGTMGYVTFKVKKNAAPGKYELKVTANPEDIFDDHLIDVPVTFVCGSVSVPKADGTVPQTTSSSSSSSKSDSSSVSTDWEDVDPWGDDTAWGDDTGWDDSTFAIDTTLGGNDSGVNSQQDFFGTTSSYTTWQDSSSNDGWFSNTTGFNPTTGVAASIVSAAGVIVLGAIIVSKKSKN